MRSHLKRERSSVLQKTDYMSEKKVVVAKVSLFDSQFVTISKSKYYFRIIKNKLPIKSTKHR